MIKVKVCGMSDPLNVREIAEARPDFMGFIFYPGSPRFTGAFPDMALFTNVPPGILKTGVFLNEKIDSILDKAKIADLEIIQLHGDESHSFCSELKASGLKVIKVFKVNHDFNFDMITPFISSSDYFLFDTNSEQHGGSGKKFDWIKLNGYSVDKPFLLSGGIGPDDVEKIKSLKNIGLYAVDINSRFETSPGIKDADSVKKFIEEIKYGQ